MSWVRTAASARHGIMAARSKRRLKRYSNSARRARAIDYHEYLRRIAALASQVERPDHAGVPASINTAGWRALYNTLGENADLAMAVDQIIRETRQSDWRGNQARERMIMQAMLPILDDDIGEVERLFPIVVTQTEY